MTAPRLNASPTPAADGRAAPAPHPRPCLECGCPHASAAAAAEFCGDRCRMVFNNRRAKRGAEAFDLIMAWRWDRGAANKLHVLTLLSRLAAGWRREDLAERDGRRSWVPPTRILARHPYLSAERLAPVRRGP